MLKKLKKKLYARKEKKAVKKIERLRAKGDLINNRPESVACSINNIGCHSYIDCIFITVQGLIFSTDRIVPGNKFRTPLSNGKTAMWSIITKKTEFWKWEVCHKVKGIFIGYAE